ncbi:hypothetical protein [Ghiorsea bivora]|uniref:hypothetical protein n=1 Tax=Ghiorsea bivora TaxID=1485545 RepID=UPI00056FFEE9|nr:hypothetical protein [Ghiorsea bivora]
MKTLKVLLVAAALAFVPVKASAGDYEVANVMDDALYGAGVGGMVGLGLMLLSTSPTSNWNYLTQGVGVGIIAGAAYGVYRSSRAFAQVEDGQINLGMPSPKFAVQDTPVGLILVAKTDLIAGQF